MARNQVQFQKGISLVRFNKLYSTEEQCYERLFNMRWANGFECPKCGCKEYCKLKRHSLYQCNSCHHQTSLTAGTILDNTKLPLTTWFLAIYLLTQVKNGISALELSRFIEVSYNTAWKMKHKLMQAMKESDDKRQLEYIVQLDDAYWGGKGKGGKRGRGSMNKVPFIAAVALNEDHNPVYMRMTVVKGFRKDEVEKWAKKHLAPSTLAISDGLSCFEALSNANIYHDQVVKDGAVNLDEIQDKYFHWVDTMIGNIKNSLRGTYHAISKEHLPRYLAEFCFRFNYRFRLEEVLDELLGTSVVTPPMPYKLLKLPESF